jgi:ubiquinone/menaquinone biosynthesis C-methylase UbiE
VNSPRKPPDWQLPPGFSPGLWEYVHSESVARNYDRYLADSPLPTLDQAFLDQHVHGSGRVIDLGCGVGRSILHLARRGLECVGVDLSEPMLAEAARRCADAGLSIDLLRANLVELDCIQAAPFDHALCLFSTLGMIRGRLERQRVLAHAARVLRPGGQLLLHVHNRWSNLWQRGARRWLLDDWLASFQRTHEPGDRYMPSHQGVTGLFLHLYTWSELVRDLRRAGFSVTHRQLVSFGKTGRLSCPWLLGNLRALGFLVRACRE